MTKFSLVVNSKLDEVVDCGDTNTIVLFNINTVHIRISVMIDMIIPKKDRDALPNIPCRYLM